MKTTTYAGCALLVGPFTQQEIVVVPDRSENTLAMLKEKFGNTLMAIVYFDIKETSFQGLKFTSEPHNDEKIAIVSEAEFEKRIKAERQQVLEVLDEVIGSLTSEQEPSTKPHHTLH